MKKVIFSLLAIVLSLALTFLGQYLNKNHFILSTVFANSDSLLKQNIISYEDEPIEVYKLYEGNQLVAVINDYKNIDEAIKKEYIEKYSVDFPDASLDLGENISIVKENVYYRAEDIDEDIIAYLKRDNHLGVKTTAIEFSTSEGVFDIIYVKDFDDFTKARDRFLSNFISEEALLRLEYGEETPELTDYGSIETNVRILETVQRRDAIASADEIYTSEDDIYMYLCYGKNPEFEYYTVKAGDTLAGVGYYYRDMSPRQLMLINPDKITNVDQILVEGTELNVTYYTSPLTVIVTKQRLSQETINPSAPIYIEDSELYAGEEETDTEEVSGLKNVLREETWINGVLQPGDVVLSEKIISEPVQAVIRVGVKPIPNIGTGNFIFPIDNPSITCRMYCYYGHTGTDLQNMYNRYGNVYAADNGTVVAKTYDAIGGNLLLIDHNNGFLTYYGHLNVPGFVEVGDTVERGQIIGQIGRTGFATGPHCHFEIRDSDNRYLDVCDYLDCDSIPET